jgi:hypothetical protein
MNMRNKNFLNAIDKKTKTQIIQAIALNYGISKKEAFEEVTYEDSEDLLDYLPAEIRTATSVLMQKHGFR